MVKKVSPPSSILSAHSFSQPEHEALTLPSLPPPVRKKAGCVPVRRRTGSASGEWEVLLVQSRWTPDVWLFPKGAVEDDETGKAAAVRETVEEGGVVGEVGPKLGSWTFHRSSKQRQKMWLLYVHTEYSAESRLWKERKKRLRAWHSFESARQVLTGIPEETQRPELMEMLFEAERVVKGGGKIDDSIESQDDDDEN